MRLRVGTSVNVCLRPPTRVRLCPSSEEEVFEAAMRWLNHSPEDRTVHCDKLLAAVRFNHMNLSELHHCLEIPGVTELEPVKKTVLDAI
ncbi:hypothetical protein V5799_018297 [Amblyomma americanum]|uniref:BACK domain-containing protein n=1 Tax=Amblyomma americanum TaxID=6943 RepID=A0AAQ4F0W3_AMBAM